MDTKANYTIVGAFVIFLTAAIVMGTIWLSSGFSFVQYKTYMVYMQEAVTGLNTESTVEYNGVDVGIVKTIELNKHNPKLVTLLLNIKNDTPITYGTVATLKTRGITGITYISLNDMGTDLRPLKAEDDQPYPVIKTAPSIFVRIEAVLTQLTTSFDKMSNAFETLLDPQNQESIKASLLNLRQITGTLAENSKQMNAILLNTAHASQQLSPLIKSSADAVQMLQLQTLPAVYKLVSNLNDVTHTLNEVSEQIKQNPSVLIRGSAPPPLGPGETR